MQTKVTPRQKMKRQVNFIFLANYTSQTMDKEMWISIFMQWRIKGRGPEAPSPPPRLLPLFFRPNWGLKGRENFFWRPSPLPPRPPRYLKVWIRFYYVSFLLFTPRIKLPIKWRIMMFIRLPTVWIVGALATVHQLCQENYRKSVRPNCLRNLGIWI